MDYRVDVVSAEAVNNVISGRDISLVESEIWAPVQHFCVVQRGAIIEFVERDDVVMVLICNSKGPNNPRTSGGSSHYSQIPSLHKEADIMELTVDLGLRGRIR